MTTTEPDPGTIVYFNHRFMPLRDATVSILTHALHYGTGVFEGIRGYWAAKEHELFLVRPMDHFQRWKANAGILRITVPHSALELSEIAAELCRRNDFQTDIYIRPLAYKSAARIGVSTDDTDSFSIVAVPFGVYLDSSKGLHAGVSSWRRVEDNAIPGRAKICGAYVNSALASDEARRCGFDEAIFLTESGHVAEGATCNVFMVRHGQIITPPSTDNILEGITRASIIELAHSELGLGVEERSIDRSELYVCDELFFTGTAVEVGPITQVDHRLVSNGRVGPLTRDLRDMYFKATRGKLDRYRHWLMPAHRSALVTV